MIDEILKHNEDFVNNGSYLHYSAGKYPRKKLAVLSCMDTRLVELLPAALGIKEEDLPYFVFTDVITNRAYNAESSNINILMKNGDLLDIAKASDLSNLESLDRTVKKHILCYVRGI